MKNRKVFIGQRIIFVQICYLIFISFCLIMAPFIMINGHWKTAEVSFCFSLIFVILRQHVMIYPPLSHTLPVIDVFSKNSMDKFIINIPSYQAFFDQISFLKLLEDSDQS